MASEPGLVNAAEIPIPSILLEAPLPAMVVTVPSGAIERTLLLAKSVTIKLPLLSNARPVGLLKDAAVPTPSAKAAVPLPANVVTL